MEACGFRDALSKFKRNKIRVFGVSVDPVPKLAKFAAKYDLKFPILADESKEIVEKYGVWGKKKFMGREYMGTHRISFLINPNGKIAKIYEKVKPADHAVEVLGDVKVLK